MKLREFNLRERAEIVELAQKSVKEMSAQCLIDYFNKIYRTKFENNGNTISDTIINKYYPDCSETMRNNLHEIILQFVFDFEFVLEEGEKQEKKRENKEELRAKFRDFFIFHNDANKNTVAVDEYFDEWYNERISDAFELASKKTGKTMEQTNLRKKECLLSPNGKHYPIACSCDPSEGFCCKYCSIELH
jgi:hypothetical protein